MEEIVQIQLEKAEYCGVSISHKTENFPNKIENGKVDGKDLIICTDQRRLQQVLLNI